VFKVPELPGELRAVHYDHFPINGESHTYHDTTPGNAGAEYRDDDVDISCGADGYVVTEIAAGEWLSYTISVPAAEYYAVSVRYAASADGGSLHLAAAGVDVTPDIMLPSTGGALTQLALGQAKLEGGVQTLRVYFSGTPHGVELASIAVAAP
jgi:hypothetical protein